MAEPIEFFVLKEVESPALAPKANQKTQKSALRNPLVDYSNDQPSYAWFSVHVKDYTQSFNDQRKLTYISATSVTIKKVATEHMGSTHGANQTNIFYQLADNKRIPYCGCFSKTVRGPVEATDETTPNFYILNNCPFPTDTASTVNTDVNLNEEQLDQIAYAQRASIHV
jgi:hypothetical protein